MKKKIIKKIGIVTFSLICGAMFMGLPLIAKAAWSETTFSAGSIGGTVEVGFLNYPNDVPPYYYGYAKVSAQGNVDAYLSGGITYVVSGSKNEDKYFSYESHERTYTETVCVSPVGEVVHAECNFKIDSPDGSATRYLAID